MFDAQSMFSIFNVDRNGHSFGRVLLQQGVRTQIAALIYGHQFSHLRTFFEQISSVNKLGNKRMWFCIEIGF